MKAGPKKKKKSSKPPENRVPPDKSETPNVLASESFRELSSGFGDNNEREIQVPLNGLRFLKVAQTDQNPPADPSKKTVRFDEAPKGPTFKRVAPLAGDGMSSVGALERLLDSEMTISAK